MAHDRATLRAVARLHASCISQGFLSSLGTRFLTVLYRAIDRSDAAVLIVEHDNSGVIGFVTGGSGMGPIYRQMLRDFPALIAALAPVMLRPRKVMGILEILRRGGGASDATLPAHELFSIAVAPAARGSGAADRLYRALCSHFREQGVGAFRIVVGDTLAPAHRFYKRMGAKPVSTIRLHDNATSTVYVQRVAQTATGNGQPPGIPATDAQNPKGAVKP